VTLSPLPARTATGREVIPSGRPTRGDRQLQNIPRIQEEVGQNQQVLAIDFEGTVYHSADDLVQFLTSDRYGDRMRTRLISATQMIAQFNEGVEDFAARFYSLALSDPRIDALWRENDGIRLAFSNIGSLASRGTANINRLLNNRAYLGSTLGEDYYRTFFLPVESLALQTQLCSAINWCVQNNIQFRELHQAAAYNQHQRYTTPTKGQSSSPLLRPADITQVIAGRGRGQALRPRVRAKAPLVIDAYGIAHNVPRGTTLLDRFTQIDDYPGLNVLENTAAMRRGQRGTLRITAPPRTPKRPPPDEDEPETPAGETAAEARKRIKIELDAAKKSEREAKAKANAKATADAKAKADAKAANEARANASTATTPETVPDNGSGIDLDMNSEARVCGDGLSEPESTNFDPVALPIQTRLSFKSITGDSSMAKFQRFVIKYVNCLMDSFFNPAIELPDISKHPEFNNIGEHAIDHALSDLRLKMDAGENGFYRDAQGRQQSMKASESLALHYFIRSFNFRAKTRQAAWYQNVENTLQAITDHFGKYSRWISLGHDDWLGGENRVTPRALDPDQFLIGGPNNYTGWFADDTITAAMRYLGRDMQYTGIIPPQLTAAALAGGDPPVIPGRLLHPDSRLYFPINHDNLHWTVVVVDFRSHEMHWYDSMADPRRADPRDVIRAILRGNEDDAGTVSRILDRVMDTQLRGPQQENFSDCGAWVVANSFAHMMHNGPAAQRPTGSLRTWMASLFAGATMTSQYQRPGEGIQANPTVHARYAEGINLQRLRTTPRHDDLEMLRGSPELGAEFEGATMSPEASVRRRLDADRRVIQTPEDPRGVNTSGLGVRDLNLPPPGPLNFNTPSITIPLREVQPDLLQDAWNSGRYTKEMKTAHLDYLRKTGVIKDLSVMTDNGIRLYGFLFSEAAWENFRIFRAQQAAQQIRTSHQLPARPHPNAHLESDARTIDEARIQANVVSLVGQLRTAANQAPPPLPPGPPPSQPPPSVPLRRTPQGPVRQTRRRNTSSPSSPSSSPLSSSQEAPATYTPLMRIPIEQAGRYFGSYNREEQDAYRQMCRASGLLPEILSSTQEQRAQFGYLYTEEDWQVWGPYRRQWYTPTPPPAPGRYDLRRRG
jgi:Ulp1 protease family, C-terminal catalytic domain